MSKLPLKDTGWTTSIRYLEAKAMARWNLLPSEWDELSDYDKAFMMQFINTEADISAAGQEYTNKHGTMVVGLGVDDGG